MFLDVQDLMKKVTGTRWFSDAWRSLFGWFLQWQNLHPDSVEKGSFCRSMKRGTIIPQQVVRTWNNAYHKWLEVRDGRSNKWGYFWWFANHFHFSLIGFSTLKSWMRLAVHTVPWDQHQLRPVVYAHFIYNQSLYCMDTVNHRALLGFQGRYFIYDFPQMWPSPKEWNRWEVSELFPSSCYDFWSIDLNRSKSFDILT